MQWRAEATADQRHVLAYFTGAQADANDGSSASPETASANFALRSIPPIPRRFTTSAVSKRYHALIGKSVPGWARRRKGSLLFYLGKKNDVQ